MRLALLLLFFAALSATALAAPKPRIPRPPAPPTIKIAKSYGVTGRDADYSAKAYRLDQAKAKRYAADFAREHNLKPAAQERIAKARVVELRTRDYPRRWSQQQKMRLYKKELIAVQRAQKKLDDYDPVASAPHSFTDKFLAWEKEQKKLANQERRAAK